MQLSRLQLQGQFETYPVEVEQIVQNAIDQVFFVAKGKHITLFLHAADHASGIWLDGNGELLERAIVNLLSNAIKYSEPHTEISVSIESSDSQITVRVQDQGHGIPDDEIEHIFEPYFRSSTPKLAANRGAGSRTAFRQNSRGTS